ncbi:MAG: hypothetical protein E6L09_02895 [Verrucomicrobia bacterium]|nr:MAG: hypothetical protein E6L09_02895 [Verrucomicrobiota bacterium]
MKFRLFALLGVGCVLLMGAGCVSTPQDNLIIGLPGKDKIVSRYEKSYDQVKSATIAVLKRNGTLVGDDLVRRVLEARIDTAKVYVALDDSEPKITKVTVQVRRGAVADIDLASEIDKQIYGQLLVSQ